MGFALSRQMRRFDSHAQPQIARRFADPLDAADGILRQCQEGQRLPQQLLNLPQRLETLPAEIEKILPQQRISLLQHPARQHPLQVARVSQLERGQFLHELRIPVRDLAVEHRQQTFAVLEVPPGQIGALGCVPGDRLALHAQPFHLGRNRAGIKIGRAHV